MKKVTRVTDKETKERRTGMPCGTADDMERYLEDYRGSALDYPAMAIAAIRAESKGRKKP